MTDEFLEELQSSWRDQDVAFAEVHARLRRQRWRPHVALGLELLGTVFAMGVGVWFALVAVQEDFAAARNVSGHHADRGSRARGGGVARA